MDINKRRPDAWSQGSLLPPTTIRAELVVWIDSTDQAAYYGWHIATGDQLEVLEITANERLPLADLPVALGRVVAARMAQLRNMIEPFPA